MQARQIAALRREHVKVFISSIIAAVTNYGAITKMCWWCDGGAFTTRVA
jgi:hypothetical protein